MIRAERRVPAAHEDMTVCPAPYLPFLDRHKAHPPGLWALDPATWVEIDAAYAPQMAYRDRLIAEGGERVTAQIPEAGAAVAELWDTLIAHLLDRYPGRFRPSEIGIVRGDGVEVPRGTSERLMSAVGRLVQEDWCLLLPPQDDAETEYRLGAASLCFPSRWRLEEKIGHPMTAIHGPVPDYPAQLAPRINRIFAALPVERPVQRLNWSLQGGAPELHWREARDDNGVSGPFYFRSERQTLRRLPQSRAVVFGIKIAVTPITDLNRNVRDRLIDALDTMAPSLKAYKGSDAFHASVRTALLT
ncbi:MAG: DUF3445 domain-containing protein [Pseudomonadota bacterium]